MTEEKKKYEAYAIELYERWIAASCLEKVPWKRLSVIHQNGWIGLAQSVTDRKEFS